jgi:hypothetical protein
MKKELIRSKNYTKHSDLLGGDLLLDKEKVNKIVLSKDITDREKFIEVYQEFISWLYSIGFKAGSGGSVKDYNYSFYEDKIDSLCAVEHFFIKEIDVSLRFLRDRNEHKILFVDGLGNMSDIYDIKQAKFIILTHCKEAKNDKMNDLNKYNF